MVATKRLGFDFSLERIYMTAVFFLRKDSLTSENEVRRFCKSGFGYLLYILMKIVRRS
jgi:hypothetical protein